MKESTKVEKKIAARQQTKQMLQQVVAKDLLPPMCRLHRKQSLISSTISPMKSEKKESCGMSVLIDVAKNVIDKNEFVRSVRSAIIVHVIIGLVRTGVTRLITE